MERFSKWRLMAKILAVEIAATALFLLAVYVLVRQEAAILLESNRKSRIMCQIGVALGGIL